MKLGETLLLTRWDMASSVTLLLWSLLLLLGTISTIHVRFVFVFFSLFGRLLQICFYWVFFIFDFSRSRCIPNWMRLVMVNLVSRFLRFGVWCDISFIHHHYLGRFGLFLLGSAYKHLYFGREFNVFEMWFWWLDNERERFRKVE